MTGVLCPGPPGQGGSLPGCGVLRTPTGLSRGFTSRQSRQGPRRQDPVLQTGWVLASQWHTLPATCALPRLHRWDWGLCPRTGQGAAGRLPAAPESSPEACWACPQPSEGAQDPELHPSPRSPSTVLSQPARQPGLPGAAGTAVCRALPGPHAWQEQAG